MRKIVLIATLFLGSNVASANNCSEIFDRLQKIQITESVNGITQIAIVSDEVAALAGTYIQVSEPLPRSNSIRYFYKNQIKCFKQAAKKLLMPLIFTDETIRVPGTNSPNLGVTVNTLLDEAGLIRLD